MTDTTTVEIVRDDEGVKITEYNATQAALAKLEEQYKGMVFDITTAKGMNEAKDARKRLRGLRTGLEARRKELKAPVLDYTRALDGQAKEITARIEALETPIDQHIKAEEARKAKEKAEAEAAERNRLEANRKIVETLRNRPLELIGANASEIEVAFATVQAFDLAMVDEDFQTEAALVKDEAAGKLHELWTQAKHAEEAQAREEAARIEREKAEEKSRQEREAREAEERAELEELRRFKAEQEAAAKTKEVAVEKERQFGEGQAKLRAAEEDEKNRAAAKSLDIVNAIPDGEMTKPPHDEGMRNAGMTSHEGMRNASPLVSEDDLTSLARDDFEEARDSLVAAMEGALTMEQAEQVIEEIRVGEIRHVCFTGRDREEWS